MDISKKEYKIKYDSEILSQNSVNFVADYRLTDWPSDIQIQILQAYFSQETNINMWDCSKYTVIITEGCAYVKKHFFDKSKKKFLNNFITK